MYSQRNFSKTSATVAAASLLPSSSIAGMGSLIDNRGTSKASRVVEMYNGRAEISLTRKEGGSVVAVSTGGIKPSFCNIA
jgi:beta-galactosidase